MNPILSIVLLKNPAITAQSAIWNFCHITDAIMWPFRKQAVGLRWSTKKNQLIYQQRVILTAYTWLNVIFLIQTGSSTQIKTSTSFIWSAKIRSHWHRRVMKIASFCSQRSIRLTNSTPVELFRHSSVRSVARLISSLLFYVEIPSDNNVDFSLQLVLRHILWTGAEFQKRVLQYFSKYMFVQFSVFSK